MRLPNLLKMAPAEIVTRSRQAMLKTVERVSYSPSTSSREVSKLFYCLDDDTDDAEGPSSLFKRGFREYATESLQMGFRTQSPARFFSGASDPLSPGLLALYLPEVRKSIIAAAEKNTRGLFNTLGYDWLEFPDKNNSDTVNWHLDAVSGKVSPLVHWSRINPLDFNQVGDSRVIWELNRHQWLVQLALAWQLTGHDVYAQLFTRRVRDWMKANPPGFGINWCSSLEVSCRLISWCWALVMFRESGTVWPFMHLSMMSWLQAHASHINRYQSSACSANSDLPGEALGLFYAGVLLPEINDAREWRETGRRILLEQLQRQTYEDDVYFERSMHCQCRTVEVYLQFMILSKRAGDELPESFNVRLQSMLDVILDMRRPDGTVPGIGDCEGGGFLPFINRAPGDVRGIFSVAAVLFDREDFAWAAGGSSPDLICLLGPSAHYAYMAMQQKPPPLINSCLYPDGGLSRKTLSP